MSIASPGGCAETCAMYGQRRYDRCGRLVPSAKENDIPVGNGRGAQIETRLNGEKPLWTLEGYRGENVLDRAAPFRRNSLLTNS